jgi:hypothetical protein
MTLENRSSETNDLIKPELLKASEELRRIIALRRDIMYTLLPPDINEAPFVSARFNIHNYRTSKEKTTT